MLNDAHRHISPRSLMFLGALAVVFVMSGCGVTPATTTTEAGSSTSASLTATAQSTGTATLSGCPGTEQSVQWSSTPTATVNGTGKAAESLTVGQTIEVREPDNQNTFRLMPDTFAPALRLDSPAGYDDLALHMCVWHFTAMQSGTAQIEFVIGPLCAANVKCPQYLSAPRDVADVTVG